MEKKTTLLITPDLIAPCGMNCTLCYKYLRDKNTCKGCNSSDENKPNYCVKCKIKNCEIRAANGYALCSECSQFPCKRIKNIDKRYRAKYNMSMIENLNTVKEKGIKTLIKRERKKWRCLHCGSILSAHKPDCLFCGKTYLFKDKK